MTRRKRFIVIYILVFLVVVAMTTVLLINVFKDKPVMDYEQADSLTLSAQTEAAMIEENYWNYVRASYILIGEYPYEYYKIASGVPRNFYEVEMIYSDDESDKLYYHDAAGNKTSKLVIDVSVYQGTIDWNAVYAQGVSGAIIRVGYRGYGSGNIVYDDMFITNIEGALDAGLEVGVYIFTQAISYNEGSEEAQFVLNSISGYDVTLPIIIDTEYIDDDTARTFNLTVEERTDAVLGFCETVSAAGYTPMIYSNRNWFVQNLDMSILGNYKLWLAQYANLPDFPYLYQGWQYSSSGQIEGISQNVDLNIWYE